MKTKDFEKNLAQIIRIMREKKGISQTTMRIDTGINIGRIETGSYSIEIKTFLRICSYLEVDCKDILNTLQESSVSEFNRIL